MLIKLKRNDDVEHPFNIIRSLVPSAFVNVPDEELWEKFKSGNEEVFIFIYNTYFDSLINYGFQICREIGIVEDAVQDLFIELRQKRNKLPKIKQSINVYLFVALKNKLLNIIRRKKLPLTEYCDLTNISFTCIQSYENEIISQQNSDEISEILHKAVNKLPFKQREALFYLFFEGYSYNDIKVLLNLHNIKSARNIVYKALAEVKKQFQKLEYKNDLSI